MSELKLSLITRLVCLVSVLLVSTGCQPAGETKGSSSKAGKSTAANVLLGINFEQGQTVRYKFVSARDTEMNFGSLGKSKSGKDAVINTNERLELVVAYEPIEVSEYGFAKIKATCESAKVSRDSAGKTRWNDAAQSFAGKSFTFDVTPSGLVEDKNQLKDLVGEVANKAFSSARGSRIKNPDMVMDFVATQWFLWDAISHVKKPAEGVAAGDKWSSKLLVPLQIPMRVARDVTYQLEEVRHSEKGDLAVIGSSYSLSDSVPSDWPKPYEGTFQMRGTFGFFRGYEVISVAGTGQQLFNIDSGLIASDSQEYVIEAKAGMLAPLPGTDAEPNIKIKQSLTMELIE